MLAQGTARAQCCAARSSCRHSWQHHRAVQVLHRAVGGRAPVPAPFAASTQPPPHRHASTCITHATSSNNGVVAATAAAAAAASSAGAAGRGKAKKPASSTGGGGAGAGAGAGVVGASIVAAAAATATVEAPAAAAPPPVTLANPPLGFSNNIVPAGPLVVTPPPPGTPLVDSSDEELDESSGLMSSGQTRTGTGRTSAYRCLVLDSRYLPVNVVSWLRAVCMDASGKADVLEYHPGGFAYSAYQTHPLPAVLRVHTFVDVHEFAGRLSLTRKNIMLRDQHCCQYCGAGKDLTLDHVVPVCRGGLNTWSNLVTACMTCNQRKGDKSLAALGWRLPRAPREPTPHEVGVIAGISKSDLEHPPGPWAPYLVTFRQVLEKAQRRAAAAAAASGNGGGGSSSSSFVDGPAFVAQQQELLLPRSSGGGGGSTAKAAAAAPRSSAGASGTGKQAKRARGVSSNAKRMRH